MVNSDRTRETTPMQYAILRSRMPASLQIVRRVSNLNYREVHVLRTACLCTFELRRQNIRSLTTDVRHDLFIYICSPVTTIVTLFTKFVPYSCHEWQANQAKILTVKRFEYETEITHAISNALEPGIAHRKWRSEALLK